MNKKFFLSLLFFLSFVGCKSTRNEANHLEKQIEGRFEQEEEPRSMHFGPGPG